MQHSDGGNNIYKQQQLHTMIIKMSSRESQPRKVESIRTHKNVTITVT